MKQEMIHTPTPWRSKPSVPYIYGAAGGHAAEARNPANRAFIVRACNAHDDLVAALTVMIDAYDMDALIPKSDIRRFRAVLAKAKGER